MSLVVWFIFATVLGKYCEGKPTRFQGYLEGSIDLFKILPVSLEEFHTPSGKENRNVNNPLLADLFEGDTLLSPDVKKITLSGGDVSMETPASRKRAAVINKTWPNGIIPYVIDPTLNAYKGLIESAMRDWENGTCLSFVPFTNQGKVYVKITDKFLGCSAKVGYNDRNIPLGGTRAIPLNLGPGCYSRRNITHELGHIIGFYHEQSRPDRDSYVTILTENIKPGKEGNFQKFKTWFIDSLGSPYDLASIMHYDPKAFSNNGKNTIQTVDPRKTLKVNLRISDTDRKQVNIMYKCHNVSV